MVKDQFLNNKYSTFTPVERTYPKAYPHIVTYAIPNQYLITLDLTLGYNPPTIHQLPAAMPVECASSLVLKPFSRVRTRADIYLQKLCGLSPQC